MRHEVHTLNRESKRASLRKGRLLWFAMCFTLLFTAGFSLTAYGAGGDKIWLSGDGQDGQTGKQHAVASAVDSDGNVFVTGYQKLEAVGTNNNYYTVKFKADGSGVYKISDVPEKYWRVEYPHSSGSDQALAVAVDDDKNVIVTGSVSNGTNTDIHTIKYNGATGEVIWQHTYNRTEGGNDVGLSIAVDSDGNVYVGGYSPNAQSDDDYTILKYDRDGISGAGNLLWQSFIPGSADKADRALSIAVDLNGVAVTGYSTNAGLTRDMLTVKLSPANGLPLWTPQRYTASGAASGAYVKLDSLHNVVVAGDATNGSATDIYIVKYDGADGHIIWEKPAITVANTNNSAKGLYVDDANDVYLTGTTWTLSGKYDIFTEKYSGTNSGQVTPAWSRVFDSGSDNDDIPTSIVADEVVDGSGVLYVTGYTLSGGKSDFQTLKYKKAGGTLLWHEELNLVAGKSARPVGIQLSPAGDPLVAGWSNTETKDYDYYVVKYDRGALNGPTGLTATAPSQTTIELSWTDNSPDESGFELLRCSDQAMTACAAPITIGPHSDTGTVTYPDENLATNTKYFYKVRAFKNGSPTLYSNYSTIADGLTVFVNPITPIWSFTYNGLANKNDYARAIAVGSDNNPVATGITKSYAPEATAGPISNNFYTVKLNKADKSVLWSASFDDSSHLSDEATCVTVDGDNKVAVSGYANVSNNGNITSTLYTIRYPQAGPPESGHEQYDGSGAAVATAVDASDYRVVVGNGMNASENNDIHVIKYNPDGSPLWTAIPFDGANHSNDFVTAVAFDANGNVFVTGYTEREPGEQPKHNFFTAKYNGATGAKIWWDEYSVVAGGDNKANSLAVDNNGDVYVTGYATNGAIPALKYIYTIKYDGRDSELTPAQRRIWEKSFDGILTGDDQAVGVRVNPFNDVVSGNIVVAGTTLSGTGDHDITIIRYDQEKGDQVWALTLQRPAFEDNANALGLDSQGNIYVAADTGNGTTTHGMAVKFDYLGNYIGTSSFNPNGSLSDESRAMVINSLNEVFVAGSKNNEDASSDFLVYKIDADTSAPFRPYSFTSTSLHTSVVLNWLDNSQVKDGFNIQKQVGTCSFYNKNPWIDLLPKPGASATFYPDNGLTPGSTFCYRIQTTQSSGAKSPWNYLTASTPILSAPTDLVCTAANTTDVSCTWNDSTTGKSGFRLYRCDSDGVTNCSANLLTANYTLKNKTDSLACPSPATYKYKVMTYGPLWETAETFASVVTSMPAIPTVAPVLVSANRVSEVAIDINWTYSAGGDETGFHIERCSYVAPAEACTNFSLYDTVNNKDLRIYNDTNKGAKLIPGTTYRYQIRAYKTQNASCPAGGEWVTPYSNIKEDVTTLMPPVLNSASPNSTFKTTRIELSWTDQTASETGFSVERCTGTAVTCVSDGDFSPLPLTAGTATSINSNVNYSDQTACAGTDYVYRVRAVNGTVPWNSGYSVGKPATTAGVVAPVLDSVARLSEVKIHLAWTKNVAMTDFTGFKIERCSYETGTPCENFAQIATPLATDTGYDDINLTPNTVYRYRVRGYKTVAAANSCGPGGWNSDYSDIKHDTTTLLAPSGLITTPIDTNSIKLDWTDNTASDTGFSVERSTGPCPFTTLDSGWPKNAGQNYFTDDTAPAKTASEGVVTYCYRVRATGTSTPEKWPSGYSNTQAGSPKPVVLPSMTSAVGMSETKIKVNWNNSSNEDVNYVQVHRCFVTSGSCTPPLDTPYSGLLPVTQTSFDDDGVSTGNTYYYQIHAIKKPAATVIWNKTSLNIVNTAPLPIAAPVLNSATPNSTYKTTQIDLAWTDKTASETGFSVERCTGTAVTCVNDGDFSALPLTAGTAPDINSNVNYSDLTACFGTPYYYRVRAVNSTVPWNGGYSLIKSATTAGIVAPVLDTVARVSEVKIHLGWTKNTDMTDFTGFKIERCSYDPLATPVTPCTNFAQIATPLATDTGYDDINLTPNTAYRYQIRAYKNVAAANSCGPGGWNTSYSDIKEATTTLIAPTGLVITTPPIDTTTIKLDWTDNTASDTGFSVERSTGPCPFTTLNAGWPKNAGSNTFTDDTAVAHTALEGVDKYCYRVRATGSSTPEKWPSGYSQSIEGSPKPLVLPAMKTAVGMSEAKITVTWENSSNSDVNYVQIHRCSTTSSSCTPPADTPHSALLPSSQLSYDDETNVSGENTYCYQVHAIKTGKWNKSSLDSNIICTKPLSVGPAMAANGCIPTDGNTTTSVTCSWTDTTTSETSFTLERCAGADCSDVPQTVAFYTFNGNLLDSSGSGLNLTGSTPTYEDGGLLLDGKNFQSVSTPILDNDSHTIEFDIKIKGTHPTSYKKIFGYTPAGSDRSPGLWVTPVSSRIYWAIGVPNSGTVFGADGTSTGTQFLPDTWYHIKGVKNGPSLKVYVDNSSTAVVNTTVTSPKAPGASMLQFGSPSFGANAILKNFKIINNFKVTKVVTSTTVATSGTTVTYIDTTPLNNKQYTYKVRANKSTAPTWESAYSGTSTVTTAAAVAPGNIQATRISEAQIKVQWDASTSADVTGYRVERCTGNSLACPTTNDALFTQRGPDLLKPQTSYDDVLFTPDAPYTYRVKAYKTVTGSANGWVMKSSGTDSETATLISPSLTATAINATQIDLSWNKATTSETNFELLRCKDEGGGCSNFAPIALLPANTQKYSDLAVLPSAAYIYKLRTFNEGLSYNGGSSAWTKKVKLAIPTAQFQPEYQTKLVVLLASFNGMKADFSDMRFFDADSGLGLPYWIESKSATSATVWFKTGKTNNIYMYYGNSNPNVKSASNIANTFIFGDDFSGDASKWDLGGAQIPNMTMENGLAHLTGTPPACTQVWHPPYYDSYGDTPGYWETICDSISYHAATKESFTMSSGLLVEYDASSGYAGALVGDPTINKTVNTIYYDPNDNYSDYYQIHAVSLRAYDCIDYGYGMNCGYYQYANGAGTIMFVNSLQPSSFTVTPGFTISTYMGDPARVDTPLPAGYQFKLKFSVAGNLTGITIANVRIRKYAPVEPGVTPQSPEEVVAGFVNTWSIESNIASASTPSIPSPEELACSAVNTTQVYCHWLDKTSAETGFKIERCVVGDGGSCVFEPLDQVSANQQEYTDTTASHTTSYKYRVYATRNIEPEWNTGYSNVVTATTNTAAAPAPFQIIAVSASEIDLTWTKITTDETGFRIERCAAVPPATSCSNFSLLDDILPKTAVKFDNKTGLSPSTDYCYRVRVFKTATPGGWDLPSDSLCDRTFPGNPASFEANPINSFTIQLKWIDSPDEDGYKIEKQTWNEKWVPFAALGANTITFVDTVGNEPLKKYKYRMKAFRGIEESQYSEAATTTLGYSQNDGTCK